MDKYFESLKILGLDKNTTLTNIKKSYLELVQIMHPDKFNKEDLKKRANVELQKINEAYDYVVKNYDRYKNINKLENNQDGIFADDFNFDLENTDDIDEVEETVNYPDAYEERDYEEDYTSIYKNSDRRKNREVSVKTKILIYVIGFILFNITFWFVSF